METRELVIERLKALGLVCPTCKSTNCRSLRTTNIRFCQRCGNEWEKPAQK